MGALDGKVAAITGASSGIGEATALALAGAGAAVAIGARREDRLSSLAERIGGDGGRARGGLAFHRRSFQNCLAPSSFCVNSTATARRA